MDNKLKYGALGIAVLFVFAMSAIPTGAADRVDLTATVSESCTLLLDETECESEVWTYDGTEPALDLGVAALGTYTVTIAETCCPDSYSVAYTFEVTLVDVELVNVEYGMWGGPFSGWPVTTSVSAEEGSLALVSVTGTSA